MSRQIPVTFSRESDRKAWCHDYNPTYFNVKAIKRKYISKVLQPDFLKEEKESGRGKIKGRWLKKENRLKAAVRSSRSDDVHDSDLNGKGEDLIEDLNDNEKALESLKKALKGFECDPTALALQRVLKEGKKGAIERYESQTMQTHIDYVADSLDVTTASLGWALSIVMTFQGLLYFTLIWMACRQYLIGTDDDENEGYYTIFFFLNAVGEFFSIIGVAYPAVVTNGIVDTFILTITERFCESSNPERASRDLQWLLGKKLGWKIGSLRPTMGMVMQTMRYQVVIVSGLVAALVTNEIGLNDDDGCR